MIVRRTQKMLLRTSSRSRVVLLRALPRAGRTALLDAHIQESSKGSRRISGETFVKSRAQDIQEIYAGQTLCVDRVQTQHVAEMVEIIRFCLSFEQSAPKFVLTGCNAKTEQELRGSLIGLITDVELYPIQVMEHFNDSKLHQTSQGPIQMAAPQAQASNLPIWDHNKLWLRGGLPESLNADSDEDSFTWRRSYLENMLQQELSSWGIGASDRLFGIFQWIANNNGEQFDDANCAKNLLVKRDSVRRSLNFLERIGVLRCLSNWPAGSNSSLNAMPVYYVRDSGLLHAMLGINTTAELRENSAIGHSWESFAIEAIINAAPENTTPAFYRDDDDHEIDLVLNFPNKRVYAIELKVSGNKSAKKGFAIACENIAATDKMVVHSGKVDKISDGGVPRLSLISAIRSLPR